MKAKRGAKRKAGKKASTRDLGALDRSARKVKGGARATSARSKRL
jgi:hypothetical protein